MCKRYYWKENKNLIRNKFITNINVGFGELIFIVILCTWNFEETFPCLLNKVTKRNFHGS